MKTKISYAVERASEEGWLWPVAYICRAKIAFCLGKGFWDLGHKLFRSTPETFPVKFLVGDVSDDAHLSPATPIPSSPPPVASVDTLTELRSHISAIRASSLFYLFNEKKQFELGKHLAALSTLVVVPSFSVLKGACQ